MTPCDDCKFWSALVAEAISGGPVKALCLNVESPCYTKMVNEGCEHFAAGRAIDDPYLADEVHRWAAPTFDPEY